MLIRTLHFEQASIIAAVVCSLIVAGLLKGTIGVGMPVVALPLLSLFIDVKSAAMLLSMPLVFSNLPQALEGGKSGRCLMQLMPVFLGMIPGLFLGVRVLLAVDANVARIIAGLVLMGVGGITLLAPKLQLQSRLVLPTGITFGFFGGILGGIAAMPGPLVFIFLLAKGLRGKAFTKEASLYLVVSAGLMAILLTASHQFSWLDVSVSTAAMLPVVLGMYVGQHMRDKIAPETFMKLVLIAVIAAGAELVRHGLFGWRACRCPAVGSSSAAAASRCCFEGGTRGLGASRPSTLRRTTRQASRRTSRSLNCTRHLLHCTEVS